MIRRLFLLTLVPALLSCQPPTTRPSWCDFEGEKPAVAPRPHTGAWSFLRCYGDGRLVTSTICLSFGERVGAKPADNTLAAPLFMNWQDGQLVLRTCAPGDTDCAGFTFTLQAIDENTMYGTFSDGRVTGQARATRSAGGGCEIDPNEPFTPEVTPIPAATTSPSPSPSPSGR